MRHYYCKNLLQYIQKRVKVAKKAVERLNNNEKVWPNNVNIVKLVFSVAYLLSFVGPLIEAMYKAVKEKTTVWFWHPIICLLTVIIYLIIFIRFGAFLNLRKRYSSK